MEYDKFEVVALLYVVCKIVLYLTILKDVFYNICNALYFVFWYNIFFMNVLVAISLACILLH